MGWYSGNPSELHPLPPSEEAKMMIDLAGGCEKVQLFKEKSYKYTFEGGTS